MKKNDEVFLVMFQLRTSTSPTILKAYRTKCAALKYLRKEIQDSIDFRAIQYIEQYGFFTSLYDEYWIKEVTVD